MTITPQGLVIEGALSIGRALIDRIWPDKTAQAKERAEAEQHLVDLTSKENSEKLAALVSIDNSQAQIDLAEAGSTDKFKSWWRPALGWTCDIAVFCYYVPYCLVATYIWAAQCLQTHTLVQRPDLGVADLIGLVTLMLGGATLRSVDKGRGVS